MVVEIAILFPVILALTFGAVQVGLWFEARNMCQSAAEAGVRAASVLNAPAGVGAAAATSYLDQVSRGLVVGPVVTESRTATTVTVRCAGSAQRVVLLLDPGVSQSATAGVERFTTP